MYVHARGASTIPLLMASPTHQRRYCCLPSPPRKIPYAQVSRIIRTNVFPLFLLTLVVLVWCVLEFLNGVFPLFHILGKFLRCFCGACTGKKRARAVMQPGRKIRSRYVGGVVGSAIICRLFFPGSMTDKRHSTKDRTCLEKMKYIFTWALKRSLHLPFRRTSARFSGHTQEWDFSRLAK